MKYADLSTEKPHPKFARLDRLSARQIVRLMNAEDRRVAAAVARAAGPIASAVDLIVEGLRAGGRLFFVGAGTSGRLGAIEAAECVPTFGTPSELVQAVIAGGPAALSASIEGAEDDAAASVRELRRRKLRERDVVVGVAASGVTPFVIGALLYADGVTAATVLVTCNRAIPCADVVIEMPTGPEVVAGSTRLKAGTATKMALNMLTTAAMVRLGKVYGNLMVDVRPNSRKLRARQVRIVSRLGRATEARARAALRCCGGEVKTAVVTLREGLSAREARFRLAAAGGRLRDIIG